MSKYLTDYKDRGFVITEGLLEPAAVAAASESLSEIVKERFDTGVAPMRIIPNPPIDGQGWRVDQPHLSSSSIMEIVRNPILGEVASHLMGSEACQAWYVHGTQKVPGDPTSQVGWHQDGQYVEFFEGDFVTAWIALSDVKSDNGPMVYVAATHDLDFMRVTGFSSAGNMDVLEERVRRSGQVNWSEVTVTGAAGTVSFHHSRLLHGSRANVNKSALRRSLTIHYRSELNRISKPYDYNFVTSHIRDGSWCPISYGRSDQLLF